MSENKDFVVEKKIKTEADIKHYENRKAVVNRMREYVNKIDTQKKKKPKTTKLQYAKKEKITNNINATKIQNVFKEYQEIKKLEKDISTNIRRMEDFVMLTKNNEQMIAGAFNKNKMVKTFHDLKQFQKEKDKNIEILGEKKFNEINDEISNLFKEMQQVKDFKEMQQVKDKQEAQSVSQQPTRPSTALSGISDVSNSSSVTKPNSPNCKTNTQQIKL